MTARIKISCDAADYLRNGLRSLSPLTDPTAITWGLDDATEVLRDELDEQGCRHYRIWTQP